jgi:hypothetical protein
MDEIRQSVISMYLTIVFSVITLSAIEMDEYRLTAGQ